MATVIPLPIQDDRVPAHRAFADPLWRATLRAALFAFVLSRVLIGLVWFAAVEYDPGSPPGATEWRNANLVVSPAAVPSVVTKLTEINDGYWYASIAKNGYDAGPFDAQAMHNWAFFPLHPMLWSALANLTGQFAWSGFLLVNLCFFAGLIVLHRLALALGRSVETAHRATLALALFPVSYFFSAPWTESLFLLLSAGSVLAALRNRWQLAGALAMLAAGTRLAGLFLLPALAILLWQRRHVVPRTAWLALAPIPLLFLAFVAYLGATTGDPLAFVHIQPAFFRPPHPTLEAFTGGFQRWYLAIEGWNFRYFNFAAMAAALIAAFRFAWRREFALAIFLLLGIAAALDTATVMSGARYAIGLFPFAIAIADWTERRGVETAWWIVSAGGLTVMSALFMLGVHFAGA